MRTPALIGKHWNAIIMDLKEWLLFGKDMKKEDELSEGQFIDYTMRPLVLARKEPGSGAYIDAEAPRIENRPERACGTNGWAVICP